MLSFLLPYLGVDPLMGCIIEVGFEGGHGAAAIMGESFRKLGFPEGLDLGFAMATVGLLASTFLGSGLVVIGRFLGWLFAWLAVRSVMVRRDSHCTSCESVVSEGHLQCSPDLQTNPAWPHQTMLSFALKIAV